MNKKNYKLKWKKKTWNIYKSYYTPKQTTHKTNKYIDCEANIIYPKL